MTAAIRVAVEICTYLFNCMFCGGICGVSSSVGGSDMAWVVMVSVFHILFSQDTKLYYRHQLLFETSCASERLGPKLS